MATATITPLNLPRGTTLPRECGVLARERLAHMLDEALTQTDDLLFKLANSADTTQRQNLCFDAMRELRLKRDGIATAFLSAWETDFNSCRERVRSRERQRARGGDTAAFMGELTLLGQDEVEENLAIANYSAAARSRSGRELHDLEQRLAALFETPHLDEEHNPLGPQRLGQHLKAALAPLESGTEVKLTLFKMLDRAGGPTLHQLYVELNQKLAAAGILPTLAASTRSTSSHRTRVIIESEAERAEESGTDVLSTLQRLLHGNPAGGLPGIGGTVGGVGATGGFGGGGFSGNGGGAGIPAGFGGTGGYAAGSGSVGAAPGGFGGVGGHAGGIPGVAGGPASATAGASGAFGTGLPGAPGMAGGTGGGSASAHGAFPAILGVGAEGGDPAAQVDGVAVPLLVQTLTDLQRTFAPGVATADVAQAGSGNLLRTLQTTGAVGDLGPSQALTLEVVSLIFDHILADRSIPDALKAVIGRLQIPLLKVALLDRELFSRRTHPARRLLDALAAAAVGWYEGLPKSDRLYDKMEQVVTRILHGFEDDLGLFETVLADFEAYIAEEATAAEARAEASSRSLRTREQIVLAKLDVDAALATRLEGQEVRDFVHQFLSDYWRQLLIVTHVEHGQDSPRWHAQLATVESLVWSIQPKSTREDRKDLSARLPALLKELRAGMLELEMPPPECSKFLSMLASVHVTAIRTIEDSCIAARQVARDAEPVATPVTTAPGTPDPSSEAFVREGLARIFERKGVEEAHTLDIDLSAFEDNDRTVPNGDLDVVDPELAPFVTQATSLDPGDWVEFDCGDGSITRARFTWISPSSGRYLFTNRQGEKMLDTTLLELAREFQAGGARIIKAESDPLFDRVLAELIDSLEGKAAS